MTQGWESSSGISNEVLVLRWRVKQLEELLREVVVMNQRITEVLKEWEKP